MLRGHQSGRGSILVAAALLGALLAVPATADAVLSGANGRIVFASGRAPATSDAEAGLYLRLTTGSFGFPGPTSDPPVAFVAGQQHRHPTWSPDRTKIAYARGTPGTSLTEDFDIFILDLTTPGATPQQITTPGDGVTSDRPAWSPDGTRIAYENEVGNNTSQRDIIVRILGSGTFNLTGTATTIEGKPAWSPDSQTIYYSSGDPNGTPPGQDSNILKEPANNTGTATLAVPDVDVSEFQPSISPDGTQICFTLGTGFNNSATVMVGPLTEPPTAANVLANDPAGQYNCTWSPNGTQVAYVRGIFGAGDLVMERADNTGPVVELEETAGRFDGNPDWAPDAPPACEPSTATTGFNSPVEVTLPCVDTGPEYERTEPLESIVEEPDDGTLGEIEQGDPSTVTYTPDQGFSGTDTFIFRGSSAGQFAPQVSATVEVLEDFRLGKAKKNKKKGTAKLAVIVPGAGNVKLAKSKKVKGKRKRAQDEGKLKLKIRPKGKAKDKLLAEGKTKVKAKVTYTPEGGVPSKKSKKVKLALEAG